MATKTPCRKHPEYRALRKPQAACAYCWRFYLGTNPTKKMSTEDLSKVINAILVTLERLL